MATKTITFTCRGSVRGSCGHKHLTIGTAAKCLRRDVDACLARGGYSDRRVVSSVGSLGEHDSDYVDAVVNGQVSP